MIYRDEEDELKIDNMEFTRKKLPFWEILNRSACGSRNSILSCAMQYLKKEGKHTHTYMKGWFPLCIYVFLNDNFNNQMLSSMQTKGNLVVGTLKPPLEKNEEKQRELWTRQ